METKRQIRSNGRVVGWVLDSGAARRVEPTHRTVMDADSFKLLLTADEFDKMRGSRDPIVSNAYHRLINRNAEVDTESNAFDSVMSAAVDSGDLTQERTNELALGVPV